MSTPYHMRYDYQRRLNDCMPIGKEAKLGDVIYDLINNHNSLIALLAAANVTGVSATPAEIAALNALAVLTPEQRNGAI